MRRNISNCVFILVVLTIFNSELGFSQDGKNVLIQIYTNIDFPAKDVDINESETFYSVSSSRIRRVGYFTPAVSIINKKGSFHEIEISDLYWKKSEDSYKHVHDDGHTNVIGKDALVDFLVL